MELYDLVKENWQNPLNNNHKEIESHIRKYSQTEELVVWDLNFHITINLNTMEYDFLGSSQEAITGFSNDYVASKGVQFLMQQMHPEDAPFIAEQGYQNFRQTLAELPVEDRKNLILQLNYRFKHKEGHWIQLIEHVRVLALDGEGNPMVAITHVYQLPHADFFRGNIVMRKVNPDRSYEILFCKTYPVSKEYAPLTDREKEIVGLIGKGMTGNVISEKLNISPQTVKTHRKNILRKLDLKTSGELVAFAITNRII